MADAYDAVEVQAFNAEHPTEAAKLVSRTRVAPAAGEVEVKVKLAGVNPSDVFSLMGVYPGFTTKLPAVAGFDGMGVVARVGEGVTSFKEGQRVTSAGWNTASGKGGSWQQYVTLPASELVALPDAITDEAGAQFFINPVTVIGLLEASGAQAGDHVIITAAGSTLSRMLIAAARKQGLKTIGVVRRADAVAELKSSTSVDEVVVFSGSEPLAEEVKRLTGGRGAHSAIDSIGGDISRELGAAVRDGGSVWLYGLMGGVTFVGDGLSCLFRDVAYRGFWLVPWLAGKAPAERQAIFEKTLALMADGTLAPAIGELFDGKDFAAAVKASNVVGRVGKVLLRF